MGTVRGAVYAFLWIDRWVGARVRVLGRRWNLGWWRQWTPFYRVPTEGDQEGKEMAALKRAGIAREAVDGECYRWHVAVIKPEMLEEVSAPCG